MMLEEEQYSIEKTEKIIINGILSKTISDDLRKLISVPKDKFDDESLMLVEGVYSVCSSIAGICRSEKERFIQLLMEIGVRIYR